MASLIDRMRARMTGSFAGTNQTLVGTGEPEKTRHLVGTNRWDDQTWRRVRRNKKVGDLVEDLTLGDKDWEGMASGPELVEGLFQSFYRADPQLTPTKELEREVFPAHKVLKELHDHPDFDTLRASTNADPFMATIAMDAMQETLVEIVRRVPPPPDPNKPKNGNTGGGKPDPNGPQQGPGDQPGPGGGPGQQPGQQPGQPDPNGQGDQPGDGQAQGQGGNNGDGSTDERDLNQDGPSEYDDWENQTPDLGEEMSAALGDAIDAAEEKVKELESGIRGIGITPEKWRSMSDAERNKVISALDNEEMKMLADMVGRMRRFALGARAQRIIDVPHVPFDVTQGDDLKHLLRSEFALLANDRTKYEFYRRLLSKETLQFKLHGTEDAGKGPIVCAIDRSGSMGGDPIRWAVGAAEALRRFAADDERDFVGIFFGGRGDMTEFTFPKGTGPLDDILKFIGTQAGGGTDFVGPLNRCLELCTTTAQRADIVFITDGAAHLTEEWIADFNAKREKDNVRCFSVYIGGAYDTSHSPVKLLDQFSNATVSIKELTPQSMERVFQSV